MSTTTITSRTKLYTAADVRAALRIGRTELWKRVKLGTFPKPIMDGRRPKWREPTIAKYLDALEAKAR
jgi:predicted DNA-binding transcriptional regulator AlpA